LRLLALSWCWLHPLSAHTRYRSSIPALRLQSSRARRRTPSRPTGTAIAIGIRGTTGTPDITGIRIATGTIAIGEPALGVAMIDIKQVRFAGL
jgi:hypothetical protein